MRCSREYNSEVRGLKCIWLRPSQGCHAYRVNGRLNIDTSKYYEYIYKQRYNSGKFCTKVLGITSEQLS